MIDKIVYWWAHRNDKLIKYTQERGYNWAVGSLMSGITLEEVESQVLPSNKREYTHFDFGAHRGIDDFKKLTNINETKVCIKYSVTGYLMVTDTTEAKVVTDLISSNDFEDIKYRMVVTCSDAKTKISNKITNNTISRSE